ncbi:MAG: class I SAM-dependent methyltransferase [Bacteroidales bacterium]|nr:class I SAM-dependent methyltransferase [Bacteroidales bacterium]
MKIRDYIFEFEDLSWFPAGIRESMTDYLRYLITALDFYKPVTPLIIEGLDRTNAHNIIDLCSGGGGAIEQIHENLARQMGKHVKITLTDKYPNSSAYEFISAKTNGNISFSETSVDAANVPEALIGFRTIFSGFHHFDKNYAKTVLRDAVNAKAGIGIFDGGDKHIFAVFAIIIMHPIIFFLFTPFFKPFRLSRLIFTYLIPVIPFCTVWDGIVSIIRLYRPKELLKMALEVDDETYVWKAGRMKSRFGLNVTYLTGYPKLSSTI